MAYSFSDTSKQRLATCDWRIQRVMNEAITNSPLDFGIACGLRTPEEQLRLYNAGLSQATERPEAKHLANENGESDAVDILVYMDGKVRWEGAAYYPVIDHIATIARNLDIQLVWGGAWNSQITNLPDGWGAKEAHDYYREKNGAFNDFPHLERVV